MKAALKSPRIRLWGFKDVDRVLSRSIQSSASFVRCIVQCDGTKPWRPLQLLTWDVKARSRHTLALWEHGVARGSRALYTSTYKVVVAKHYEMARRPYRTSPPTIRIPIALNNAFMWPACYRLQTMLAFLTNMANEGVTSPAPTLLFHLSLSQIHCNSQVVIDSRLRESISDAVSESLNCIWH